MQMPKRFRETTKLIKLKSNDGLFQMSEEKTHLGREYYIDPASKRMENFYDPHEKLSYMVEIIEIWDEEKGKSSILPVELLDV